MQHEFEVKDRADVLSRYVALLLMSGDDALDTAT